MTGAGRARAAALGVATIVASAPALGVATVAPSAAGAGASPTASEPTPVVTAEDLAALRDRRLLFPVPAVSPAAVPDSFGDSRGARGHEALDVPAPHGAPVVAVDDGTVAKLFASVPGGLTIYLFDRERRFAYYYAHLEAYAAGLAEGNVVRRGDVVGYVGSTGNAPVEAPHLHFAIFKLEPTPRWWRGAAINPHPLWTAEERPPR